LFVETIFAFEIHWRAGPAWRSTAGMNGDAHKRNAFVTLSVVGSSKKNSRRERERASEDRRSERLGTYYFLVFMVSLVHVIDSKRACYAATSAVEIAAGEDCDPRRLFASKIRATILLGQIAAKNSKEATKREHFANKSQWRLILLPKL